VSERLSQRPTPLDANEVRHRKTWIWKMFDRACRGGIEGIADASGFFTTFRKRGAKSCAITNLDRATHSEELFG